MRAADAAYDVRGAALLVISVKDKKHVERALQRGIRAVARFGGGEQHVEEMAGIVELGVGVYKRHAERVAVGESREGGYFSDEAIGLVAARLFVQDIFRVGIEGRKRG